MRAKTGERFTIGVGEIGKLIAVLRGQGYRVIGPTIRDGAIVYGQLDSSADLPSGWTEEQDAGAYRLKQQAEKTLFSYSTGPIAWKKFLFPPRSLLWEGQQVEDGWRTARLEPENTKFAFLGVRSCDLHAIAIQDKIFLGGKSADSVYRSRREGVFIVAVQCTKSGGTCFCASMQTGPRAASGFDLALTELWDSDHHRFLAEVGTVGGAEVLESLSAHPAQPQDIEAAGRLLEKTASEMGRRLDTANIRDLLYCNAEHPRWDDIASRCLSCGNCTMVCPTCFCSSAEDATDLTGTNAQRWRRWDSCFSMDFSYLHGGSIRSSVRARYRQWLTHKLAAWIDQFGVSGCVGCGRCITWCPVGIDLTKEIKILRKEDNDGNS